MLIDFLLREGLLLKMHYLYKVGHMGRVYKAIQQKLFIRK